MAFSQRSTQCFYLDDVTLMTVFKTCCVLRHMQVSFCRFSVSVGLVWFIGVQLSYTVNRVRVNVKVRARPMVKISVRIRVMVWMPVPVLPIRSDVGIFPLLEWMGEQVRAFIP